MTAMIPCLLAAVTSQDHVARVPLIDNPIFAEHAKYWIETMPKFGVTGFSVVVIKDGQVVLLDSNGAADPFADKPADIDTRYYIASITKTMTATGIAQLAEQGRLNLDDPVQKYLPRFVLKDRDLAKAVTVRDLLCHKPGIDGGDTVFLDAYTGAITEDRYYALLANSDATKQVKYENTHYTLLGRVIESVTGKKWQDYLAENVFNRIGMSRTTAKMSDIAGDTNFAPPLLAGPFGPAPAPYMKTDRTMHAAGGVLTTPRDIARFMLAFMNGGTHNGASLLRPDSVQDAFKHQSSMPTDGTIRQFSGFGYAWSVGKYRDHDGLVAHGGGYTGYAAFVAMIPEKKMGMAVLANTDSGAPFGTIVMVDVFDKILGYPVDVNLRADYEGLAAQFFERAKTRKPISPNPAFSGLLSLATDAYPGRYANELYGNVFIRLTGGYLALDFDDLPQILKSTGMDEFSAHDGPSDSGTPCKFVVADGACIAVEVNINGKWLRFRRR